MRFNELHDAIESGMTVRAFYGSDRMGTHALGRIIGYYDVPTVIIETPSGEHVTWRADFTEEATP